MKNENPSNEPPFTGHRLEEMLKNPYRLIIANEARRLGIGVELVDAEDGAVSRSTSVDVESFAAGR